MLRWFVIAAVSLGLLSVLGCHRFEKKTSGLIGCPAKEIEIRKKKTHWARTSWQAECRGESFYCIEQGGSEYSSSQINCTKAIPETDSGGAVDALEGCQYDTQCKGDRICEDARCIDPGPEPSRR